MSRGAAKRIGEATRLSPRPGHARPTPPEQPDSTGENDRGARCESDGRKRMTSHGQEAMAPAIELVHVGVQAAPGVLDLGLEPSELPGGIEGG